MIDDIDDMMDKWREGDDIFYPWLEEEEKKYDNEPDYGPETCVEGEEEDCNDEDSSSNESSSSSEEEDYNFLEEPEVKLIVRPNKSEKNRFM